MLTRVGFLALLAGVGIAAAGRVFGLVEVLALGLALVGVVVLAVLLVLLPRPRLEVDRRLRPARVHAGDPARVDLRLLNPGGLPTGVLWLHDKVSGTPGAVLRAAPLIRGRPATASYRLPTARRGIITVGPLTVDGADPLGFARRRLLELAPSELVVYPPVVEVAPPPRPSAAELATAIHSTTLDHVGDEFHALRPYNVGDDLRRVHWPATPRHDQLMIRQHDDTRESRTVVMLDTRHNASNEETFEAMASAAASLLVAAHRRGDELGLVFTTGTVDLVGASAHDLETLLDRLARVNRSREATMARAAVAMERAPVHGSLVAVLGTGTDDAHYLTRIARPFASSIPVRFPAEGVPAGAGEVTVPPSASFADAWHQGLAVRRAPYRPVSGSRR